MPVWVWVFVCVLSVPDALRSSVFTDLRQRKLVIREKRLLEQNPQSGGNSAPRLLLEIVGVKGLYPYLKTQSTLCCILALTQRQKKSPVIGFLVPFYVKHSKSLSLA